MSTQLTADESLARHRNGGRPGVGYSFEGFKALNPSNPEQSLLNLEENVRILLREHEELSKLKNEFWEKKNQDRSRHLCQEFLKTKAGPKLLSRYESFFDKHGKILIEKNLYGDFNTKHFFPENPPKLATLLKLQYEGLCEGHPYPFVWESMWHVLRDMIQEAVKDGLALNKLSPRLLHIGGYKDELSKRANLYLKATEESKNNLLPLHYRALKAYKEGDKDKAYALAWATTFQTRTGAPHSLGKIQNGMSVPQSLELNPEDYLKALSEEYAGLGEDYFRLRFNVEELRSPEGFENRLWEGEKAFYRQIDRLHAAKTKKDANAINFTKALSKRCYKTFPKDDKLTDAFIDELASCLTKRFTYQIEEAFRAIKEMGLKEHLVHLPPGALLLMERVGSNPNAQPLSSRVLDIAIASQKKIPIDNRTLSELKLQAGKPDYFTRKSADREKLIEWATKTQGHAALSPKEAETLRLFANMLRVDAVRGKGTDHLSHASLRGKDPTTWKQRPKGEAVKSPIQLPKPPRLVKIPWREGQYVYPKEDFVILPIADLKKVCAVANDHKKFETLQTNTSPSKTYRYFLEDWYYPKVYGTSLEKIIATMKEKPAKSANEMKAHFGPIIEKYYGIKWEKLVSSTTPPTYLAVRNRVHGYLLHLEIENAKILNIARNQCLAAPYMAKVFDTIQSQLETLGDLKPEILGKKQAEAKLKQKFKDFLLAETGENIDALLEKGVDFGEIKRKIAQALVKKYLAAYRPIQQAPYDNAGEIQLPFEQLFLAARAQSVVPQTDGTTARGVPYQFRKRVEELMTQANIETNEFMRFYEGKMTHAELTKFKVKLKSLSSHPMMEKSPEFASAVGLLNHWIDDQPHNPLEVFANGNNRRYRASHASKDALNFLAKDVEKAPAANYQPLYCEDDGQAFFEFMKLHDPKLHETFRKKPTLDLLKSFYKNLQIPKASVVAKPLPKRTPDGKARAKAVAERIEKLRHRLNYTQRALLAFNTRIDALLTDFSDVDGEGQRVLIRELLASPRNTVLHQFMEDFKKLTKDMDAQDRLAIPPDALLLADRYAKLQHAVEKEKRNLVRDQAGQLSIEIRNSSLTKARYEKRERLNKAWKAHEDSMLRLESQQLFLDHATARLRYLPRELKAAHVLANTLQQLRDNGSFSLTQEEFIGNITLIQMYCIKEENKKVCEGSSLFSDIDELLSLLYTVGTGKFEVLETETYDNYQKNPNQPHPLVEDSKRYFSSCSSQIYLSDINKNIEKYVTAAIKKQRLEELEAKRRELQKERAKTQGPKPPIKAGPIPPAPAVAEKPKPKNTLSWTKPDTFLGKDGKPKSKDFLNANTPFRTMPEKPGTAERLGILKENHRLLVEAMDLLAPGQTEAKDLKSIFGNYYKSKFEGRELVNITKEKLFKLRLALIQEYLDQVIQSGSLGEKGRWRAATRGIDINNLLSLDWPDKTSASNHNHFQKWVRNILEKESVRNDPAMEALALIDTAIDDYWHGKGHTDHSKALENLRREQSQRKNDVVLSDRLRELEKEAEKHGLILTGKVRQWILDNPDVAQKVSDLSRILMNKSTDQGKDRLPPKHLIETLLSKNPEELDNLHSLWGRFALLPIPNEEDFNGNRASLIAAIREADTENKNRLGKLVEALKKGNFTYGEIQQLLGDYLLRTRGFTPFQMLSVLDPRFGLNGSNPNYRLREPMKEKHLDPIIAQLQMDQLGLGHYFREETPLPGRPDLSTTHDPLTKLSRQFAPHVGTGAKGEKLGFTALLRNMVLWQPVKGDRFFPHDWEKTRSRDRKFLEKELPFLDSYQREQFMQFVNVLRKLPSTHVPDDKELSALIANEIFHISPRKRYSPSWNPDKENKPKAVNVPLDQQYPGAIQEDIKGLVSVVRGLHSLAYPDPKNPKLSNYQKAIAPLWLAQATLTDHPELILRSKWMVRQLNESKKAAEFLEKLEKYDHAWVELEEIQDLLKEIDPKLKKTDPGTKKLLRDLSHFLRTARWIEQEREEKGKVSDKRMDEIIGHSIYGILPGTEFTEEQKANIEVDSKWVKMALHFLEKGPLFQGAHRAVDDYLKKHIHAGIDGLTEEDKLYDFQDAATLMEFMRMVKMFSPKNSKRAKYVRADEAKLQRAFIDNWAKAIEQDHTHFGAILPASNLAALIAAGESRDDLLRRISSLQRKLSDAPPEIDLNPKEDQGSRIVIDYNPNAKNKHHVQIHEYIHELLKEPDAEKFALKLQQAVPIVVKDSEDFSSHDKKPEMGLGTDHYAPALAIFRCRLLDAIQSHLRADHYKRSDPHRSLVVVDNSLQTPLGRRRLLKIYAKLVRDVEVKLLNQILEKGPQLEAYVSQLKEVDPATYLSILRQRVDAGQLAIPGCNYLKEGKDFRSALDWNAYALTTWDFKRSLRHIPSEVSDDEKFLSFLNGDLMIRRGKKISPPKALSASEIRVRRLEPVWSSKPIPKKIEYPAFESYLSLRLSMEMGLPHDAKKIMPSKEDWANKILEGIKEPEKERLKAQLDHVEKEANKLEKEVISIGGTIFMDAEDVRRSWKLLERASKMRSTIYRDIANTYTRHNSLAPMAIPSTSELRLLGLPNHTRHLLAHLVARNRYRAKEIRKVINEGHDKIPRKELRKLEKELNVPTLILDSHFAGDKFARDLDLKINQLLINPDLSTIIYEAWQDPETQTHLIDGVRSHLPLEERFKFISDMLQWLPEWKAFRLEEKEEKRDQFLKAFEELSKPTEREKSKFTSDFERRQLKQRRQTAASLLTMIFRVIDEGDSLKLAHSDPEFGQVYEETMGGDRRFDPEVTYAELKRERELAKKCEEKDPPPQCEKLKAHIENMHNLHRTVSNQTRRLFLDVEEENKLTDADLRQIKRLEEDILPHVITSGDKDEQPKVALELLRTVPSRTIIDEISRKYDLKRYLSEQLEEKHSTLSTEIINNLLNSAGNGKAFVLRIQKDKKGNFTSVFGQKECKDVRILDADLFKKGGEIILRIMPPEKDEEKLKSDVWKLAEVSAYKKAYEQFKLTKRREPTFEELKSKVTDKVKRKEYEKVYADLSEVAAQRYLEKITKGKSEAELAALNLSSPTSKHGCAMRALLGPKFMADADQKALKQILAEHELELVKETGNLPPMTQDLQKKIEDAQVKYMNSPDLLHAMDNAYGKLIAKHDGKEEELRWRPHEARISNALREQLPACFKHWKEAKISLPKIEKERDPKIAKLAELLEQENLGMQSFHQITKIETTLLAKATDLSFGATALDLKWFTDPKTGRIAISEKQLARFKDPDKNPQHDDEDMKKQIARMEKQLESYKRKAKNLREFQATLRLRLEASMSAPIEGDITQEELQVNQKLIARVKYLIYKKIKEDHEKTETNKRPLFSSFPSLEFIGSLERDPELNTLVDDFNKRKAVEMENRRDEYKLPDGYSVQAKVPELNAIKLRGMIRRTAALVRMERTEDLQERLQKLAIQHEVTTGKARRKEFDELARQCMEWLLKEGRVGFKRFGAPDEMNFIPEDVESVKNHLIQYQQAKNSLKVLVDSLLPPVSVESSAPKELLDLNHPSYQAALAHLRSEDSPVRLTEDQTKELAEEVLKEVFQKRNQESKELKVLIESLAELGFQWDGASLQWGEGKEGLKLHLIGRPGIKIGSLSELKKKLETLKNYGSFRQSGTNPWRLLMSDIWGAYAKAGFKPMFEFGNSALCMAEIRKTNRSDGYYQNDEKVEYGADLVDSISFKVNARVNDGNKQATNLCLLNKIRVKDGKRYSLASVPPDYSDPRNTPADNFLTDFNNGEKYLAFMPLEEARAFAQAVHDKVKSNVSGDGSDYHKAIMDVRGESSNLWAGFAFWSANPETGTWTGPWNGIAARYAKAEALLDKEHDKLTAGIRSLERLGAIKVDVSTDSGTVEQPAGVVAQSYRQQKDYILNPEKMTGLSREVMDNINNMEETVWDEIKIELLTLATLGIAKGIHLYYAAGDGIRAARYAQMISRNKSLIELGEHAIKGHRSAYRFSLGGKVLADTASLWGSGKRGYTITQPLNPHHIRRSGIVFTLLPIASPGVQYLAQVGRVPAHLIPWVANPLAMGGTHYAVELAHGADPGHALVGSVPMTLFGFASPLSKQAGKIYAGLMKSSERLGKILGDSRVRGFASWVTSQSYFSGVTGAGAVLSHWATPEVHRDPETGKATFRHPFTGEELDDATILDIALLSMLANFGMDAYFAKGHVKEIQAHAAAHLVRTGTPYKSVLELFGGTSPEGQQDAHALIMQGLAHTTSVNDWRKMQEQRKKFERALEKDPTDSTARTGLDSLKQVMAIVARAGGHGKAEMGVFEEEAIAEYTKRLEEYAQGGYDNHMLFVLNAKIARETYLKNVAALRKKPNGGSLKDWLKVIEDPSFANAGEIALTTLPPEIVKNGLRNGPVDGRHREPMFKAVSELAAQVGIPVESMPAFAEYLRHYKARKGETLYSIARRFRNLEYAHRARSRNPLKRIWNAKWEDPIDIASAHLSGEFAALVAEGKLTPRGLAKVAEQLPAVLGNLRLADVHVLQRQASGTGTSAREANYLLDVLAGHFNLTREQFEQAITNVSKSEPETPKNAVFGKTKGKKLTQLEDHLIPEVAKTMREQVVNGEAEIESLIEVPFFQKEENYKYVPPDKFDLNKTEHRAYVEHAAASFLDSHPVFKRYLLQRGIPLEEFQKWVCQCLEKNPNAHTNLADAIVQARETFMGSPSVRNHIKPGEILIEDYKKLEKEWNEMNPGDPINPELVALANYGGFKTADGKIDIPALVRFLGRAERAREHGAESYPVRELMFEATRLARLDMAEQVRQGKMKIEDLLNHDLFKTGLYSSTDGSKPKYSPEAAALVPQDLVIKAFHNATDENHRNQLATHIAALAEASGYTYKDHGLAFVNFVLGYKDSDTTIVQLAHLFNRGSARKIGDLVVSGKLDVEHIALLPEKTLAGAARVVGLDWSTSRMDRVIGNLRVKDVNQLIAQARDQNHPNHENAKKTLILVSNQLHTTPQLLITFMEGYSTVKEAGPRTYLPSWLGGVSDPRQERPMRKVASDFWKSNKETVREALDKDPDLLDKLIESDFFSTEGSYAYLPPNSLILTPRSRPVPDGAGGTRMKTFINVRDKHIALVEKAAEDAFKDPTFSRNVERTGISNLGAVKEFKELLKRKLIDDPAKYPNLQMAIDAAKSEYLNQKKGKKRGSIWPSFRVQMAA